MKQKKEILDVDTGSDDAVAIMLAVNSNNLDIGMLYEQLRS